MVKFGARAFCCQQKWRNSLQPIVFLRWSRLENEMQQYIFTTHVWRHVFYILNIATINHRDDRTDRTDNASVT